MINRLNESRAKRGEAGFTLIELLVVIIILGILAAVVVFAVGGIGDKGQASSCRIDTRTLRTAEEAYAGSSAGNGNYTANEGTPGLVGSGFLSEISKMHNVVLKDPDGTTGPLTATQGFDIVVEDPKCGAVGAKTGTCGAAGAETACTTPTNL